MLLSSALKIFGGAHGYAPQGNSQAANLNSLNQNGHFILERNR
jgi:hypothetical protein